MNESLNVKNRAGIRKAFARSTTLVTDYSSLIIAIATSQLSAACLRVERHSPAARNLH